MPGWRMAIAIWSSLEFRWHSLSVPQEKELRTSHAVAECICIPEVNQFVKGFHWLS